MKILSDFNLKMDKDRILKTIQCSKDSPVYEEVSESYDQLKLQVESLVEPRAMIFFDENKEQKAHPSLEYCKYIVYVLMTLGEKISNKSGSLFAANDYLGGVLVDAMGDALLFQLGEEVYKRLREEAKKRGLGLTFKLEGGEELPMEYQKIVCDKVEGEKHFHMRVTEGYMLDPVKSAATIYGADPSLPLLKRDHDCAKCPKIDCPWRQEYPVKITVLEGEKEIEIDVVQSKSIFQSLQENKIYMSAICGGRGTCGKCKIQVIDGALTITGSDRKVFSKIQLQEGYRLGCCAYPTEDCTIRIDFTKEKNFQTETDYIVNEYSINSGYRRQKVNLSEIDCKDINSMTKAVRKELGIQYQFSLSALRDLSSKNNKPSLFAVIKENEVVDIVDPEDQLYGLAIDIGTTTVAIALINLETGELEGNESCLNSQRAYGADVISRIQYASDGNMETLTKSIGRDILEGIKKICKNKNITANRIYTMAIAGNTTMLHLLLKLDCKSLGVFPFTTVTTDLLEYDFEEIFGDRILGCKVALLPGISAYVGADIVAGMLRSEFYKAKSLRMLIDVGTNGEMVIGNKDRILSTATAAGPAFEGGNISCGTGSIPGAISSVKYRNGKFQYKTIGDQPPVGICGTGVIDMIAEGLKHGWIEETGALVEPFADGIVEIAREAKNPIVFTQKDIREFQLAKSAIRAGIESLLLEYGCSYEDVEEVYLAGGFGSHMNISNTVAIGMIPKEFEYKVQAVGNSSLGGAVLYLLHKDRTNQMKAMIEKSRDINLSSTGSFNDLYIKHMMF